MRRHPIPFRSSLDALRRLKSGQLAHKDVEDLDGRDEAEAEEQTEDSTDAADERNFCDLFLRHVFGNVRVLDVDVGLDQIFPRVLKYFLSKRIPPLDFGLKS